MIESLKRKGIKYFQMVEISDKGEVLLANPNILDMYKRVRATDQGTLLHRNTNRKIDQSVESIQLLMERCDSVKEDEISKNDNISYLQQMVQTQRGVIETRSSEIERLTMENDYLKN